MGGRPNNGVLMTPFKPPRKIDQPTPSTSKRRSLISRRRRRRTSSCDSDSPALSYDSNSTNSDSENEDEEEDQNLLPPTYPLPLTPPTSSPPPPPPPQLNPPEHHAPDTLSDSDSDSDSLLRVSTYDLLLARIRKRRVGMEKSRGVEGVVGEVRGLKREYEMERVKKRPFIAPAVALTEEEEEKEEDQQVRGMGMKVKKTPNSEVEMGSRSGNDSDSSGELRVKKREVFVGKAYKRPRRVESSEKVMDRQERSNRIMKLKDDSSYAMPDEERLDSQESQEDWLPSPEQVFGMSRGYSKSTSDSE